MNDNAEDKIGYDLNKYIELCHNTAIQHGFWDKSILESVHEINTKVGSAFVQITNLIEQIRKGYDNVDLLYEEPQDENDMWIDNKLLLIATEISEALQKFDTRDLLDELADIFIRLVDLVGFVYTIADKSIDDFETIVKDKMEYNITRPRLHNKEC